MRIRPAVCFSLGCEKSVDHDGLELACSASIQPSGFATNDCRSGIDCGTDCIGKNDFAAVRNPFWIDSAMSGAQTSARTGVFRAFIRPVTSDTGKDRLLARESSDGRRQQKYDCVK